MKINLKPYSPRIPTVFWCSECDLKKIDSNKPETGSFFLIHGHQWNNASKDYSGDPTNVLFAVCKDCSDKS